MSTSSTETRSHNASPTQGVRRMGAAVDTLTAEWLQPGVTIGAAMGRVEQLVILALELKVKVVNSASSESDVLDAVNTLHGAGQAELAGIFQSRGPLLSFVVADQVPPLSPPIARFISVHASLSKALLSIQDRLLADRALLARASEELERSLAHHQELIALIRDGNSTSEVIFEKLVVDPEAAPAISKLLNAGLSQNALWDLIKLLGTAFVLGS